MASTFAFGFSGDDIDVDDDAENEMHIDTAQGIQDKEPELLSPQKHTLGEIVWTQPFFYISWGDFSHHIAFFTFAIYCERRTDRDTYREISIYIIALSVPCLVLSLSLSLSLSTPKLTS